ncbi:hypothetical protein LFL96_25980 [Paraburkholderia sp. D15]|uniref:hypothetical protein n=1 Tax=Paraburkholderia sp. D15 TaxID=2880218 RepID=UPI0024786ACE|nr:hypothetical protein [Paraburkholderia sp. D15]WGS54466.1 hypothetical protein LFL96_25980 [Paraburkholderia sp. D15]
MEQEKQERTKLSIEGGTIRIVKQLGGRYAYVVYVTGHKKVDIEVRNGINKVLHRQDFEPIHLLVICELNHKRSKFDVFYQANIKEVTKVKDTVPFTETQIYENWLLIKEYFIALYRKHFGQAAEE